MPTDVPRTPTSVSELTQLGRAFDAACRELGIGLAELDVLKREQLVKRAMRIAHTNDPRRLEFLPPSRP